MKINKKIQNFLKDNKESHHHEKLKLDFAIQLESIRIKSGLSYAKMAIKNMVSLDYLSDVFRGDVDLTAQEMQKLMDSVIQYVHEQKSDHIV